jgi:hypothetical protein
MEEQTHDLHSFDWRDLSTGLEEIHSCMVGIEDECVIEAVAVGHGNLRCPHRSRGVSHPGHPPSSKVSSGGLGVGRSHFGVPARGTFL